LEEFDGDLSPDRGYVSTPPGPELAHDVAWLWQMRIPVAGDSRVRIMPNACVDIVLYGSETSQGEGSASLVAPPHRGFIVGSTLKQFFVRSTGWRHIVGATIAPSGVQPILGVPAASLGDGFFILADVIGQAAAAELEETVLDGPSASALDRLRQALVALRGSREPNAVVSRAVNVVRSAGGAIRMDHVVSDANVSQRQLERRFLEQVGLSPKTFARLVRFDRAVRDIPRRGAQPWSQFALEHGYSDQAHFINEFREFGGTTPAEFESETSSASGPADARPDDPTRRDPKIG
jgi:AraC-like DNA-binding protein